MKTFIKVIIWALLSIMMQAGVFLFLDKVYFKETTDVQVEEVAQPSVKSKDIDVNIPQTAENILASSDSRYISYNDNGSLKVIDVSTAQVKDINPSEDAEILYSTWVPKNNIILMAEKRYNKQTGDYGIFLTTYNVKNDVRNDIKKEGENTKQICTYFEGTKVNNIVSSHQTGVTYVCVSKSEGKTAIYRIDTNSDISNIGNKVSSIEQMQVFQHLDILIYKDAINGTIYKYNNENLEKINTSAYPNGVAIIGLTNSNLMVLGVYDQNKKITSVIQGKYDTDVSTWTKIDLEKPKELRDIFINEDDQIVVNDSLAGKVKNLATNEYISYEGKIICITNKAIISNDGGKIYLKSVKDVD